MEVLMPTLLRKDLKSININSGYSDISLRFDPAHLITLDIRHINAFLVLPDKNIKTEEKALNEEKKEYVTYGTVGKNPGTAKVKIDATREIFILNNFYPCNFDIVPLSLIKNKKHSYYYERKEYHSYYRRCVSFSYLLSGRYAFYQEERNK